MSVENLVGQTLGNFQLRQLLGTGGMGAVYRAYQANLKREVAIKVLPASFARQPGYIERFNREAEIAASLEHAHIVPVYDYGTQDDISYVVMRYLKGGSLAERLNHQKPGRRCTISPVSCTRSPARSITPTPSRSFTATSKPTTSCSTSRAMPSSSISASPSC